MSTFPYPPPEQTGLLAYLKRLYAALVASDANYQRDLNRVVPRITATEPPDPHSGMLWVDIT
jgi:hypothetical protein